MNYKAYILFHVYVALKRGPGQHIMLRGNRQHAHTKTEHTHVVSGSYPRLVDKLLATVAPERQSLHYTERTRSVEVVICRRTLVAGWLSRLSKTPYKKSNLCRPSLAQAYPRLFCDKHNHGSLRFAVQKCECPAKTDRSGRHLRGGHTQNKTLSLQAQKDILLYS